MEENYNVASSHISHFFKYFYPEELLKVPEFSYQNKYTILKPKELTILHQYK
jgi:hypothetical protein